jgi:hypothetical protein
MQIMKLLIMQQSSWFMIYGERYEAIFEAYVDIGSKGYMVVIKPFE